MNIHIMNAYGGTGDVLIEDVNTYRLLYEVYVGLYLCCVMIR